MFFVIESSIANNQMANAITVKETLDEARMLYHQIRSSALANPEVTYNLAHVIDETGRFCEKLSEYHGQAVINPEPEPTPEPTEDVAEPKAE